MNICILRQVEKSSKELMFKIPSRYYSIIVDIY